VEDAAFFRLGVAGRVVAPNGRGHFALLAVDRKGTLLSAVCACTPKLLPEQLCMHLGALVLSYVRDSGGPPSLPGERFERSPWFRAAEEIHDRGGLDISPQGGALSLRPYEARLGDLTRSPDEASLNLAGVLTQRQSFEASKLYLVAKRAFEAVGNDLARVDVELSGGALGLVTRGDAPRYRLPLTAGAIEVLLRETPAFFSDRGLATAGEARESVQLTLQEDGALLLSPAYLLGGGTAPVVVLRDAPGHVRCGRYLVLEEARTLVPLAESRRPFVERSAPVQSGFDFDDVWRPSPAGVPLDRSTRIPSEEVAAFLSRHRAEIAGMPDLLLPAELRGGGLAEPEGAVLTVAGREAGRFLVALDYLVAGTPVPFGPIARSRKVKAILHPAAGRLVDPQDRRFGWMDLLEEGSLRGKGASARLLLSPLEVCRLRSYLPADHRLEALPGVSPVALEELERLSPDTPAPPPEESGLTLYDFQRTGYAWLWFLHRGGFGGLLCDDMGLGKTHQVMALLAAIAGERKEGPLPTILVVAPASVLPHWEEKLRRYLPSLPVLVHQGADRGWVPSGTAVLTTYGTLRNDAGSMTAEFDLFVLDEIQAIKNRETETHQALRKVRARVAIGLTGTPVENRVGELHALLDFVLPGYLPPAAAFQKSFARPIEEGDEKARERLQRLIRPFILRRTKEQVSAGLPEKVEDRRSCEMTPGQAELYRRLLSERGSPLRSALEGPGPVSTLHVFALLDKLKQLCDHPDLLLPAGSPPSGETSGKWEAFTEIVDEALGSGLKVVVFSQYLRMLDRIEVHLTSLGVGHAGIRGATTDRAAPIARFRDDPSCVVFAASLKAAGLGIDLTPASVVIHYDRWWNKAREDQATDRVHRIGQKRGVQVITLVTRGTVEERIDRLIAAKARLADDVVPEDDPRVFRRFSREELRGLLEP
jgi:superfamily II DNA or RNA helicase